jgi:hypothetical protein
MDGHGTGGFYLASLPPLLVDAGDPVETGSSSAFPSLAFPSMTRLVARIVDLVNKFGAAL